MEIFIHRYEILALLASSSTLAVTKFAASDLIILKNYPSCFFFFAYCYTAAKEYLKDAARGKKNG